MNKENMNILVIVIGGILIFLSIIYGITKFGGNTKVEPKNNQNAQTIEKIEQPKSVEVSNEKVDNVEMTLEEKLNVKKPEMLIDQSKSYTALIQTSEGDIKVKLNAEQTPITVNNFVYLARLGFYNNVPFHRIIDGFMIQSGDPRGNGTGGPAYKFDDEKFTGEYKRGTLAMANSGKNTNGSQFFIMHKDNPLPQLYVIFGNVEEGLDVVDKIATAKVIPSQMGEMSTPASPVTIKTVEITEE